ncbi:MAG: gliding motility-associated C-terminal domain-containing protein, partial [Bacteroidota bacterium]
DECSVAVLTAPAATDNCGGVLTVTHDATLPITAQGITVVTWTYDDGNGNTSTQTQNVVINDVTPPVPDVDPLADVTDECSVAALTPPTATDNCGGVVTVTHDATLPITTQGTTVVTWTYDDGRGNISTQTQNIVIDDNTLPVITCSSDITQFEDMGFSYATVIIPDAVTSDNCNVTGLTWALGGATTESSPAAGINQLGTHIFNTGVTTAAYTLTDVAGNTATCTFTVTVNTPSPLSGSIVSQTNVACFGESTGSVTVAGSGGVAPYEYSLNGGTYQASDTFSSLTQGFYTVTVRDTYLSTFDIPVTITEPAAALSVSTTQTEVLCSGGSTGTAAATAAGGTAPYDYSWNTTPVQTTAAASGLSAGTYTVTATDANGCIATANITITEPPSLTVTINGTNVLCNGGSTGNATALAAGGTVPYTYSWSTTPVQSTATASGLTAGSYTVTVTDAQGCTVTGTVTISEPAALALDAIPTSASCPDSPDGSITLAITGGTSPVGVIWADGFTTQNRTGLLPGTYSVVVTDVNSCAASLDVEVDYVGSFGCLVIPEIITPNGDGFNDEWIIRNVDIFPDAEIKVFNRWGRMVYNGKNLLSNPWDGTFKGKPVPTDSYHYILYLNDGSDPRSGVISVIREK